MNDSALSGRYKIIGSFEDGGMSHVFKSEDLNLERIVAIKFVNSSSFSNFLEKELQMLLRMRSKHVVEVFDIVSVEGQTGIVMEFITGFDLYDFDFSHFTSRDYLRVLWQMCSGIDDVHESGLIHRDLKPNNMKIDGEGILKIFDFGISKESVDPLTVGFKGTYGFAAPEMLSSNVVTTAVDIYAFGMISLFILNGKSLPVSGHFFHIDDNVFKNEFFTVYPMLVYLIKSCIDSDPAKRPVVSCIKTQLEKLLLENMHVALAVYEGKQHFLHKDNRAVKLNYEGIGQCEVSYNGNSFVLNNIKGEVMVNRHVPKDGDEIPYSCVIALGLPERRGARKYVTFDISNPEVIL